MDSVYEILEALESDGSRNYKEDLLKKNRRNELLRQVFVATSDPYTNYYVSKFKLPPAKLKGNPNDKQLQSFLEGLLPKLSTREVVGNEAKALVEDCFGRMTTLQQKWSRRILLRNLRVGVMETTINKVWPGSITKFAVQLAETLEARHEAGKGLQITEGVEYPVRVEPKLDGLRCIVVKQRGEVSMYTRSGSLIETLPTIKAAIEASGWDDYVLDGEAMGRDWNESASVVMSHKQAKDDSGMVYNVFDAMSLADWREQDNQVSLKERVELVEELVQGVGSTHVQVVEGWEVKNEAGLMKRYAQAMEDGYEGIMVKRLDSPYIFKRSDAVLKLKPVVTYEGVVVGNCEGNRGSKREGMWGGFLVLMPNGIVTRCGGGFTDKQRAEIDLDPDSWIGRVVELEGQPDPLTEDGLTVDGKVRFPVFVRERDVRDVDSKVMVAYKEWKRAQ